LSFHESASLEIKIRTNYVRIIPLDALADQTAPLTLEDTGLVREQMLKQLDRYIEDLVDLVLAGVQCREQSSTGG